MGGGMNETISRFGYPATLIADYEHWVVLLRPAQPTLGSLVLAAKGDETSFADLPQEAFAELQRAVADIERALGAAVRFEKINYLMLMMVDPNVHFHVIPRYDGEREACGVSVRDAGWPKIPALGEAVELDPEQIEAVVGYLEGILVTAEADAHLAVSALAASDVFREIDLLPFLALDRDGPDVGAGLGEGVDGAKIPAAGAVGLPHHPLDLLREQARPSPRKASSPIDSELYRPGSSALPMRSSRSPSRSTFMSSES